jgi:hypothetical protein
MAAMNARRSITRSPDPPVAAPPAASSDLPPSRFLRLSL